MKKKTLSIATFMLAVLVLVPLASADTITLNLTSPTQTGAAGSTISFGGTVTALSDGLGEVFLNSADVNLADPSLSLSGDPTPFLLNFPLTMTGGDSVTGELFTVLLPGGLLPGTYTGVFDIVGGSTFDATDIIASANFTIDVPGVSPVPEPETYVLMATGLGALLLAGYMRRNAAHGNAA